MRVYSGFFTKCMQYIYIVEPAITLTLYSDHLYIAATFKRSLQDFPYYKLPVYNGHLYITAILTSPLGGRY